MMTPATGPAESLPADDVLLPAGEALLYGAVCRPPAVAWERAGRQVPRLLSLDEDGALRLPGVVRVVVRESFIGVVARSSAAARYAAGALRPQWDLVRHLPSDAIAGTSQYRWPLRPAGANARVVADFRRTPEGERLCVWAPLKVLGDLQAALCALLGLAPSAVSVVALPGHAAEDHVVGSAVADAALMSASVGQPVALECRVGDAFPGAYLHTSVVGSRQGADGELGALSLQAQAIPLAAPPLALVLTGVATPGGPATGERRLPMAPLHYWIDGAEVQALPAPGWAPLGQAAGAVRESIVFAQESHVDEIARASGQDPVALRLRHLDPRGAALVRQVAGRAGWAEPGTPAQRREGGIAIGRGFAYAHLPGDAAGAGHAESREAATQAGWSAWVVDVEVDVRSGEVAVTRVVVGHDSAQGGGDDVFGPHLQHQGQAFARQLTHSPDIDTWPPAADSPLAALLDAPGDGALSLPTREPAVPGATASLQPLLQANAAAMLPAAAAVANAIFDATGIRLREPPFAGEVLRRSLQGRTTGASQARLHRAGRRGVWAAVGAALTGGAAMLFNWGASTAPIAAVARPAAGVYSEATVERGRLIAAAGDCVACHTAPGGLPNVGGLGLPTPFGTIYSTNITPDVETGIGGWSYAAFERAMRHGISRDGRRLYPAFPYTAFARLTDGDMQALYAYLMAQPAVRHQPAATRLKFPYSVRPLLAGWNLAFHDTAPFSADPMRSIEWNRGAYLVNGIGHCGACHTPRNALGAERTGTAFLAGGEAEGWRAPALGAASLAPLQWTEEALYTYLRFGSSREHGPAAGPMRQVVQGLATLADSDVRAIAHYLANLPGDEPGNQGGSRGGNPGDSPLAESAPAVVTGTAARLQQRSDVLGLTLAGPGARLYEGACASCHDPGPGGLVESAKLPLALNTNLHEDRPDNLIQVLLHGMEPALPTLGGSMPAFADTFDDQQIEQLAHYLRARFAPDRTPWHDVQAQVARIRAQASAQAHR